MKRFNAIIVCCLVAAFSFVAPGAFAQKRFIPDGPGFQNWNVPGNWTSGTLPDKDSGDTFITNRLTSGSVQTVTGAVSHTAVNFMWVGGTEGDFTNVVQFGGITGNNASVTVTSRFGVINRVRGVIVVTNSSELTLGNNEFTTFNNSGHIFIKRGSTLTLTSGGIRGLANAGTIVLDTVLASGAGSTVTLNYRGLPAFTNDTTGTIIKLGGSGAVLDGSVNNRQFYNRGTIDVRAGTLIVNPGDAFTDAGFQNTGTIIVNDNATFIIDRTANAWTLGGVPNIGGTVIMGGDTAQWTTRSGGSASTTRTNNFTGTVRGAGYLNLRVINDTGTLSASNGTLRVLNLVGAGGHFRAGNAVTSGTLTIEGVTGGGGTISGGSMAVTNNGAFVVSANVTINVAAQYGGIGANDRGSLISSNSGNTLFLNNAVFQNNSGTLMVVGGSGINYGQIGGDMVNNFVMTGVGTFTGNFGGADRSLFNNGTIAAVQGGVLTLDPRNAFNFGGVSNAAGGTMIVSNASTLAFRRNVTAWDGSSPIHNAGTLLLDNGTVATHETVAGLNTARYIRNSGTIIAQGTGGSVNIIDASLENRGTVLVTNDTATLGITGTSLLTNTASGVVQLGTLGGSARIQATNVGQFVNQGTIRGQGTLQLGREGADAQGANANLLNQGTIIATNFGSAAQGTLTINPGNAFANGGLRNDTAGTILVGSNMNVVLNRQSAAWGGGGGVVSNLGTVFMQGGTFSTSTDGGAAVTTANRTNLNTGLITGWGTYRMLVTNASGGQVLADARTIEDRNQGTLTVSLLSFTNNAGTTIGAIGTNSTLRVILPGPAGQSLVNFGTIQLSGGNIDVGAGTISNYFAIAGVGDASSFPIVQVGANASLIAKDPTDGLTALLATVNPVNSALLGAVSNANGRARLDLTLSSGNVLSNAGTIALDGGFVAVNGTAGSITNTGFIRGFGTGLSNAIANQAGGTIVASNGTLRVGLLDNRNSGSLEARTSGDTLVISNAFVDNLGTMKANGGTIDLIGSTITNSGTIVGSGNYLDNIINASGGQILANGGVMNLGTASAEVLNQAGGFVRVSAGTLSVGAQFWNNEGVITNSANLNRVDGEATTGVVTNSGLFVNTAGARVALQVYNSGVVSNAGGTFLRAVTNAAAGTIRSSGGSFTGSTFHNAGTFIATNSTVFIDATTARNEGTMISGLATIQITNLTQNMVNKGTMLLSGSGVGFEILRQSGGVGDFTNDVTGVIRGSGFFKTADFTDGGQNFTEWNKGTIVATNGSLIFQPGDAFANGGFVNESTGVITSEGGATFGIQRTDNAWANSSTIPRNEGTIQLSGGSITLFGAGLVVANDRSITNAATGRILGQGTINASVINVGTINMNQDGTLQVNAAGAVAANPNGIRNAGTIVISTNRTLVLNRSAADWVANEGLNNSGTLRMQGGIFQSKIGNVAATATNFLSSSGSGGIYGHGTFSAALDAQGGTISAEGGTLTIVGPVVANAGGAAEFKSVGAGNVLRFLTNATFVSSSTLRANSGGEIQMVGTTAGHNKTIEGILNNTGGSLVITGAHTVFLSNVANRVNSGTIALGGAAGLNYTKIGAAYTNEATIRTIATGGTLAGVFGTDNFALFNKGTLIAGSGGTLTVNPNNAFSVGFENTSTGRIIVEDTAHFIVSRTASAWTDAGSSKVVNNNGTVLMSGGTFATFEGGSSFVVNRHIGNFGVIEGYGFFRASLSNAGTVNITGGLMEIDRFTNTVDGVINVAAGSELRKSAGVSVIPVNFGTINMNGGSLTANGTLENRGLVNFAGGTLSSGTHLRNFGQILTRNGEINIDGSTLVTNIGGASIFVSNGTMNVNSPLFRNAGDVTLFRSTGTIAGGALNGVSGSILVSGTAAKASHLVVGGVFTNAGRIEFFQAVGTFNSAVVNSGLWITDPTTNVFNSTVTHESTGVLQADAGDVFVYKADLINKSASNETWNTLNVAPGAAPGVSLGGTKFTFDADNAGGTLTQQFFHAGLTLTGGFIGIPSSVTDTQTVSSFSAVAGFSTNFALGTLDIGNETTDTYLQLVDSFGTVAADDGKVGALFVNTLNIFGASQLIISNNMRLYFVNSNNWSLANITLLGGAEIHQLTLPEGLAVIPEPSVVLLWLTGIGTLYGSRRRNRKNAKRVE